MNRTRAALVALLVAVCVIATISYFGATREMVEIGERFAADVSR